jgi:4-hydroxy-tetrahydrodipicolinate synthase
METAQLRGSIVPLVTPFKDGQFDEKTFLKLIEFQIENGTHGLSVAGTTGEPSSLSAEEREYLIETLVRGVRGRVPVVPGTGSNNLDETLRFTKFAQRLGVDAVLVIVPYYLKPSQEGLYRHFRTVAQEVPDLPIIIYNIPGRTAVNMTPETMARLRHDCKNIVGVKESNMDFQQMSHILAQCGRDFLVYCGIEALCFPMLALGGAGHVSATGNLLPHEVAEMYNLCAAGKWEEARDLHFQLLDINEMIFYETNPGPLKAALGLMGLIEPELRLPLAPVSDTNLARIKTVLRKYKLID